MARGRAFGYVIALCAIAVALALLFPRPALIGLALASVGGGLAFFIAWYVVSVGRIRPPGTGASHADSGPDVRLPQPPSGTEATAPPEPPSPVASETVPVVLSRDRLRVLLAHPRPLDRSGQMAAARVAHQLIVDALKQHNPDVELAALWPATPEALQKAMASQAHYHIAVIETEPSRTGILLENTSGLAEELSYRQLGNLLVSGEIRLLVLRQVGPGQAIAVPTEELLQKSLGTIVIVPPSLSDDTWSQLLAQLVNSIAQGEVVARALTSSMALLDNAGVTGRERPTIVGSDWRSLVDRATDRQGLKLGRTPGARGLRWQPWFRDGTQTLSRLLTVLRGGAKAVCLAGKSGKGVTSLAIEAGHRLSQDYSLVHYVDCAGMARQSAEDVLARIAIALGCKVNNEADLADAVAAALQRKLSLIIVDGVDRLPESDIERLVTLAEACQSGTAFLFTAEHPVQAVGTTVTAEGLDLAGALAWIRWLGRHERFEVVRDISEDSVRALLSGTGANALGMRLAVGLSDRLGLLQAVRTARDAGTLDALLAIAIQRCGRRDLEAAAVLCTLPGPLSTDFVSSVVGHDAATPLQNLARAGLTVETATDGAWQLHPHVKAALAKQMPPDSALMDRVAAALTENAKALAWRARTAESPDQRQDTDGELLQMLSNYQAALLAASSESGPLAGRAALVRDIASALAPALRRWGLVFEALKVTLAGEDAARRLEDYGARGYLLMEAAENWRLAKDYGAAAAGYEEAATVLEQAKDLRYAAEALVRLSAMHWESGNPAAARGPLERALAWLERLQDLPGQVRVLTALGDSARMAKDAKAAEYYKQALALLPGQPGAELSTARLHYALARHYADAADYVSAADEFALAVEAFTAAGDQEGRLQAYRGLGQAYLRLDDRERALQALERAAHLEEREAFSGVDAAVDLGQAYLRQKRWDEALDFQRRALSRALASGDRRAVAIAQNGMGNALLELGERKEAVKAYEEAAAVFSAIGDDAGLARTYNNLAVAYRRAGNWEKARQYLDLAAASMERRGDKAGLSSVYNNLGLLLASQRKPREAAKFYERSLALRDELGDLYGARLTRANIQALRAGD